MSRLGHRLIAFDAFGTLFSPRSPIATQYASVTKAFLIEKLGRVDLSQIREDRIQSLFAQGTNIS
jgi:hypothetical protein